ITWNELGDDLMLLRKPGVFACGEMIDWDAPTGGYLLQACFATARRAADGANAFTRSQG
ncbi:MAG: aminoacetone oxidase family FAD-binding enzyme, partial [Rhodospirillales bacterium]